jgi:prepilin-type N-terminal cleavage/methylation domain-containing protein
MRWLNRTTMHPSVREFHTSLRGSRRRGLTGSRTRGFTVVELVVVLMLVGILSVVAVSRMASKDLFTQRASADELAAAMRQAHKRAIAQRGAVTVSIDTAAGVVRFCRDALPGCPNPLIEPGETSPLRFVVPAGATMSVVPAAPVTLGIDGLGRVVGASADTTDILLDSSAAVATVRTWTETGLTEMIWSPR